MTGAIAGSLVAEYREAVFKMTESLLRSYIDALPPTSVKDYRTKEFNDPVWGTIVLQPEEVVVLDSPLLQRLRQIRQLGVAHLVYPSAVHTRLEHSLGVCHQVGRLAASINAHSTPALLTPETIRLLRLTGLCHDVGHGLMSHVVENALRNNDNCEDLLLEFRESVDKDGKVQLSEVAAHFMLASPAFADLLRAAFERSHVVYDASIAVSMSKIVIGMKIGDEMPLLHELISGPFDADKLDYMPRDASMCGVPVVTDVNRLVQKVRAVSLATVELPIELQAAVMTTCQRHVVVGLAPSGASTLDEVAIGRSLMFDKIYRHQKVRAAEAMVAAVIDQVGDLISANRALVPLVLCDEEFLLLDRQRLVELAGGTVPPASEPRVEVAIDLIRRLRARQIFVRAFAFSQHMPRDPYRGDVDNRQAVENFMRSTGESHGRRAFVDEVADVTREMLRLLNRDDVLKPLPGGDPTPYIWVDPPASSIPDTKPDPSRAYLIGADGRPQRVDQVNAETRGWSDAYVNTHDMGYVFTIAALAPYVHLASEVVAVSMFGARVSPQSNLYSKQDATRIDTLRRALEQVGFYSGRHPDLRPVPSVLLRGNADTRLTSVVARFGGYSGPTSVGREKGVLGESTFTQVRVRDWVRQFGSAFASEALQVVEGVRIIGRTETNAALGAFLGSREGDAFAGASIVPIGQPKDGSAIVAYHDRDVVADFGCSVRDLPDALTRQAPIVMVDDFIGRGSSTLSIFQAMLGMPGTERLNEDRPDALVHQYAEQLRARPVAFVYAAGLDEGENRLVPALTNLGMRDVRVFVHVHEEQLPKLRTPAFSGEGPVVAQNFLDECSRIGRQLLDDGARDDDWISGKSLGYGNLGLLVVSSFNTPTATLTALWAAGVVDGWQWRPLFPRLKKP